MHWVAVNGINGGHCECNDGETRYGSSANGRHATTSGGIYFDGGNTVYGRGCCPDGTYGWSLNQSDPSVYRTVNGIPYNGASAYTSASEMNGRCLCPTGTGPKDSSSYQGQVINASCACPTGTNWYEGSGCLKCPPGSTWDATCEQCLCNAQDTYGYTYGVYSQTNSCARKQFNVPGGYFSTMTCSAGCTMEAHYYDATLNCCYCSAQAGNAHDSEHDVNGCYIGSN